MQVRKLAVVAAIGTTCVSTPWARVARAPVHQVELGIIGPDIPSRPGARLPGIAFPRFVARLARPRDGVGLPHQLAGALPVGLDGATDAILAARIARHHQVLVDYRRRRDRVPRLVVDNGDAPQLLARLGIQSDHSRIEPSHEHPAVGIGDATVVQAAAHRREVVVRQLGLVFPLQRAGPGVQREHVFWTGRGSDIHRAVNYERRGLLGLETPERMYPRHA